MIASVVRVLTSRPASTLFLSHKAAVLSLMPYIRFHLCEPTINVSTLINMIVTISFQLNHNSLTPSHHNSIRLTIIPIL